MRVLSVDLGTSNTVAVLCAPGLPPRLVEIEGSATMPSAVFALDDGGLAAGRDAQRRARLDPARYEPNPKRRIDEGSLLLGDVVVPATDALAAVLRRIADEAARLPGGDRLDEVRLTHPGRWGPVQRGVLFAAAHRVAGFACRVTLIPEPLAAAAHYATAPGRSPRPGQALAVYDLGAGGLDCSVLSAPGEPGCATLASNGLDALGGLDLDRVLAEHLAPGLRRPRTAADPRADDALVEGIRSAREALSRHQLARLPAPFADVCVTRRELEVLIRPYLLRGVDLLAGTVHRAGLTPSALAGVYLVGGAARIPLLASLIAERLGVQPTSPDRPETAIAFGAHHVPREAVNAAAPPAVNAATPPAVTPPAAKPRAEKAAPPRPGLPPAQPGSRRARRRRTRRRKLLLATGTATTAAVLLAAGAVAAFALAGRAASESAELPASHECSQPGAPDADGFTRCLRQLAGTVPAAYSCSSGLGAAPAGLATGVSVNCRLDAGGRSYQIVYTHADDPLDPQPVIESWAAGTRNSRIEADWAGNGLRGRYVSTVDEGGGLLAFGVEDRPLYGMLIVSGAGGLTPDELADYFERHVQPGT